MQSLRRTFFRWIRKRNPEKIKSRKNTDQIQGASVKLPDTSIIKCGVLPQTGLLSCIPQGAARKYAVGEAFSVHLYEAAGESLIVYFGKDHVISSNCDMVGA